MTVTLVATLLLSVLIGLSLGLLGGGGSILTVPILVYALGFSPKQGIAMGLGVVGVTSTSKSANRGDFRAFSFMRTAAATRAAGSARPAATSACTAGPIRSP